MESILGVLAETRDFFNHHIIFNLGMLLITGFFFGQLAEKIKLPPLTGYIIAGLFLGQSVTGIIPAEEQVNLTSITEIALGIIALTIGGEFNISKLRRIGRNVVVITFMQAVFAFVLVAFTLRLAGVWTPYALLLGAIGVATAPAATVIIARELRARGEFIDYLFGVVALDDIVAVMMFSMVFTYAASQTGGGEHAGLSTQILHVAHELGFSVVIGLVAGYLLHILTFRNRNKAEVLLLSIGLVFLASSFALVLHLSLIITTMTMGAVLVNLSSRNRRIFTIIEPLTPPIFALFFIIAGTELHPGVLLNRAVILWGSIFLVARFLGKAAGVYAGALMTGASASVRRYLGLCLFPQAGVSIGLVLFIQGSDAFTTSGYMIGGLDSVTVLVNIVLFNVLINELIGPVISRYGIIRGAELE